MSVAAVSAFFARFLVGPLVAREGRGVAPHFPHTASGPCRPSRVNTDLIPSFEGYFIYGLSAAQRKALGSHQGGFFDASVAGRTTLETLARKNYLKLIQTPSEIIRRSKPIAQLTTKAFGFDCRLPLAETAAQLETIGQVMVRDGNEEIADYNASWYIDASEVVAKVEQDLARQLAAIKRRLEKGLGER
jgi:hypothetical protein